jgi:hypothetical protein
MNARWAWLACFTGVALVFFGSAYYHLAPDNGTLVWDRLADEHRLHGAVGRGAGRLYVNPRNWKNTCSRRQSFSGVASVFYWHYTDDLRPYVLVQFLPLLMIPVLLLAVPRSAARPRLPADGAPAFYIASQSWPSISTTRCLNCPEKSSAAIR